MRPRERGPWFEGKRQTSRGAKFVPVLRFSKGEVPMRKVLCLIYSLILCAPLGAAQISRLDSPKIAAAAQDATGRVWAAGSHPNLGLYQWEGNGWKSVTVSSVLSKTWPWTLTRAPDGAVYVLWSDGLGNLAVTRHRQETSTLLAQLRARLRDRPGIFADTNGNVWITEQGRHIFRVTPSGSAECVYTIRDEQFREEGRPQSERWMFNPIYAAADGRGRVWFWSNSLAGRADWASLEGVLIFDGTKFEHHPRLAGVPDTNFSVIAPADAEHMWLAAVGDQLYQVDTSTMAATPAAPGLSAFRNVLGIFQLPQLTYVVAGSTASPVSERSGDGRFCTLWQGVRGTWTQLINGLDAEPATFQQPARPLLATADGLWVGGFGDGPWLLQRAAETLLDWRYGNPLDGSEALFQLPDDRMLIVSLHQASIALKPSEFSFRRSSEVSTLNPPCPLAHDAQHHLWGILAPGDRALSEWNGREWIAHPFPEGFPAERASGVMLDSLGRVWLPLASPEGMPDPMPSNFWTSPDAFVAGQTVPDLNAFGSGFGTDPEFYSSVPNACRETYVSDTQITCDYSVGTDVGGGSFTNYVWSNGYNGRPFNDGTAGMTIQIFDPKQGAFKAYASYDQALEAQLPLGKDFHLAGTCCMQPQFTGDGRIGYFLGRDRIRYFNGRQWQEWSIRKIFGPKGFLNTGAPFFDGAGNLTLPHMGKIWEFTEAKGWQPASTGTAPAAEARRPAPHDRELTACDGKRPGSVVKDRLGAVWLTSQNMLYRKIGDQCAPQFAPDEHQPFLDSRRLQGALLDPLGNAFLTTWIAPDFGEYVIVKARPLPHAEVRASVDRTGDVTLHFSSPGQPVAGFTWRVDGGPWRTPTKSTETTLPDLSNGTHRVEASSVDERLQIDLSPSAVTVEVHISDVVIQELIQQLADPDFSKREKAVAALARRPDVALPLLQSAREKAGADQRWWIDAAIQQISDQARSNKQSR